MAMSFLDQHLRILFGSDTASARYLRGLPGAKLREYLRIWRIIDGSHPQPGAGMLAAHREAEVATRRSFARIQELDYQVARVRADWVDVVVAAAQRQQLWAADREWLRNQIDLYFGKRPAYLYGRIKSDDAIQCRLQAHRMADPAAGRMPDLWDVIGFRIVVNSLDDLLAMGLLLREKLADRLIRCRNYYYRSKRDDERGAYRALHFVAVDVAGYPFELQMITVCRNAFSLLDHDFSYKPVLEFLSPQHEQWLIDLNMKANIVEFRQARGPEFRCLPRKQPAIWDIPLRRWMPGSEAQPDVV